MSAELLLAVVLNFDLTAYLPLITELESSHRQSSVHLALKDDFLKA